MGWEIVTRIDAPASHKIPPLGVSISSQVAGGKSSFVTIGVGVLLAKALGWSQPEVKVRVMVGKGEHAGQFAISEDHASEFVAKRTSRGCYTFRVNSLSAHGRFKPEFAKLMVEAVEIVPPAAVGGARRAIVTAPAVLIATAIGRAAA